MGSEERELKCMLLSQETAYSKEDLEKKVKELENPSAYDYFEFKPGEKVSKEKLDSI